MFRGSHLVHHPPLHVGDLLLHPRVPPPQRLGVQHGPAGTSDHTVMEIKLGDKFLERDATVGVPVEVLEQVVRLSRGQA